MQLGLKWHLGLWLGLGLLAGCSAPAGTTGSCMPGIEGCACADGACGDGLSCLSNRCVNPGGSGNTTSNGNGGDGGGSSTSGSGAAGTNPSGGTQTSSSAGAGGAGPAPNETVGPAADQSYALGTITIGESHASASDNTTSLATAFFVPQLVGGAVAAGCWETLGSCRKAVVPDCGGCASGEYCGLDSSCASACLPFCSMQCATGEYCSFTDSGSAECVPIESFDAGELSVTGAREAVVMTPPYSFTGLPGAPLFDSSAALGVRARGSSGAGFAAFEQAYGATTLLSTNLNELSRATVFSQDDLSLSWAPANDEIALTFTAVVDGGSAVLFCDAEDAAGAFSLPRASLVQAVSGGELLALTVSVARRRGEWYSGFSTQGTLSRGTVEPAGWLELVTTSTETYTYQACTGNTVECGAECADLMNDVNHCGECDNACPDAASGCQQGQCVCDTAIEETLCGNECAQLVWDSRHCGTCDNACAANAICDDSTCQACPSGQVNCDESCTNLNTDYYNCGACGNVCERTCDDDLGLCEGVCNGGECDYSEEPDPDPDPPTCTGEEVDCGGECVNTDTSTEHCGECDNPCGSDQQCIIGFCEDLVWDCDAGLRGDGTCDCGCGSVDPDCADDSVDSCDACVCLDEFDEESCDAVEPDNNAECL